MNPANADILYSYAEREGMFKSTDRGLTWQSLPFGTDVLSPAAPLIETILVDRSDPAIVYAASGLGQGALIRSTDAGVTWKRPLEDVGIEDLENDPAAGGTVWAAGYSQSSVQSEVLYRSVDYGATWQGVAFPDEELAWLLAFEVDPTNSQVLWAAGGLFEPRPPQGVRLHLRIHRSADGGLTWQRRDSGIEAPDGVTVLDLAIDPANPNRLYAATLIGLFRTTDAGITWTRLNDSPVTEVETSPTAVYASMTGIGIFRSTDGGANWSPVREGLGAVPVLDLTIDPTNPRRLYAGTGTRSLFTYEEP